MPRTDADSLGDKLDPTKIVQNLQKQSKGGSASDAYQHFVAPFIPKTSNDQKFEKRVADPQGTIFGNANQPGALGDLVAGIHHAILGDGSGGGKKKKATDTAATDPPAGQAAPTQQSPDDVFTAGLGMFFSQYLAPMMSQINNQNQGLISQYGNAMNNALSQQLPAGVASVMKPYLAQNEQLMALANNAGAQQLTNQIPFQNLVNALGSQGQGLQALATALPTAAADQALGSGNPQAVAQMFAQMGLANTPVGAAGLSLLTQPSFTQSLLSGGKTPATSSTGQQQSSITPIQVLPGQTPTATPTAQQPAATSNLANTAIAQQLAQAMLAQQQQPNAGTANALAGSGYTP